MEWEFANGIPLALNAGMKPDMVVTFSFNIKRNLERISKYGTNR
jgi:thymidylate kinase